MPLTMTSIPLWSPVGSALVFRSAAWARAPPPLTNDVAMISALSVFPFIIFPEMSWVQTFFRLRADSVAPRSELVK